LVCGKLSQLPEIETARSLLTKAGRAQLTDENAIMNFLLSYHLVADRHNFLKVEHWTRDRL